MVIALQSGQIDIEAYANHLVRELNEADSLVEWLGNQLELTIWTTDKGLWKAEVLITYGGPNVTLELDSRWSLGTLHHSWGYNATTGEKQTSIEFVHSGLANEINANV